MNFDEALRHMQEGTATDEEKAYVEEKLQSANRSVKSDAPRIIENPKPAKIKGQKRERSKFFTLVAVIIAIFLVLGAIFAGVFGSAAASAKKVEVISKADAQIIAQEYVYGLAKNDSMGLPLVTSIEDVILYDIDHDLHYDPAKPANSYYVYEIIYNVMGATIEVELDTRNGNCRTTEVDN